MQFEEILRIHISIDTTAIVSLTSANGKNVAMIPFGGNASGKYFEGKILPGAVDTQVTASGGVDRVLSARYVLDGVDIDGQRCKIYIENTGTIGTNTPSAGSPLFKTHPIIITDSKALDFLNGELLVGEGIPSKEGITIIIYRMGKT